jgi:putative ABC transport system ATP-binding protein
LGELSHEELARIRNQELGFVFQQFNLLPHRSVLENVQLPLYYSNVPKSEWRDRALRAIETVGLTHRTDHAAFRLSGGERQRVAIARALINEPNLIFADEPTGNLDSVSGGAVLDTLGRLHTAGHTIVLITHDNDVAQKAKRVIFVRDGAIESDTTQ